MRRGVEIELGIVVALEGVAGALEGVERVRLNLAAGDLTGVRESRRVGSLTVSAGLDCRRGVGTEDLVGVFSVSARARDVRREVGIWEVLGVVRREGLLARGRRPRTEELSGRC